MKGGFFFLSLRCVKLLHNTHSNDKLKCSGHKTHHINFTVNVKSLMLEYLGNRVSSFCANKAVFLPLRVVLVQALFMR